MGKQIAHVLALEQLGEERDALRISERLRLFLSVNGSSSLDAVGAAQGVDAALLEFAALVRLARVRALAVGVVRDDT